MLAYDPTPSKATQAVNLRVKTETKALIDRAAKMRGKSRSEFMIDASRTAAEETLLDQTYIRVDQETYDFFLSVLDNPTKNEGYERLMGEPKPWKT